MTPKTTPLCLICQIRIDPVDCLLQVHSDFIEASGIMSEASDEVELKGSTQIGTAAKGFL